MAETTEEILAKNEALAKLVATREKDLEILKKLDAIGKSRVTALQREVEFYADQTKLYRESAVAIQALVEAEKQMLEASNGVLQEEELRVNIQEKLKSQLAELTSKTTEQTKAEKEKIAQLHLSIEALADTSASVDDVADGLVRLGDNSSHLYKAKDAADKLGDQFNETASNLLSINNNWNEGSLTGRMLDATGKGASLADSFGAVANRMKETLNPTNLLGSAITGLVNNSIDLTKSLDRSFFQFNQATGGGEQYLDVISDVTAETYQFGIDTQEAMEGVKSLYTELAMFSRMSKEAQTEMGELSAKLQVLGVNAQQTAATADLLMQSVGFTKDEFADFQGSLKSMSNAIGVPMSTLHDQFVEGADIIGKYGKKGVDEFRKLAAAAKATGIEMSSLLDIAGQFDTFESAAERVGSLNAILGGAYFDTVQMVNATEEERIDLLRRGVQASGKTFDQLGRYEKKAIAAAAGIQDINEANKLFGQSTAAYEELQMLASNASMSLADLSEEAFNTLSPMEKFQAVLRKFQKPLDFLLKGLDMVATLLFKVVSLLEDTAKWLGFTGEGVTIFVVSIMAILFKAGGVIKFITGLFGGLFTVITSVGGAIGTMGGALTGLSTTAGPALAGLGGSIKAFGLAILAAAKPLALFGLAVAGIGAGIGLMAFGMAQLVKSFKDLSGEQIMGGLAAITLGLGGIALVIPILLKLLPALGAAAAVAFLPLLGMSLVLSSIAESLMESTPFVQALGTLMAESSKMTPQASKAAQDVLVAATNLAKVEVDNNNAELIKAIADLNNSVGRSSGASQGGGGGSQLEVTVNIDGKQAWKGMAPYFEKQLKGMA